MNTVRTTLAVLPLLLALPSSAQDATGAVAGNSCTALVTDNRAAGGELVALKVHNPGGGPDEHTDINWDLSAKGGVQLPGVSVGGATYNIAATWKHQPVPPEELFVIVTYPDGTLALDSSEVRDGAAHGTVLRQRVGDSLPIGIGAGIGLQLPGSAAPYTIPTINDQHGTAPASFPYGSRWGIEVAFSPIAEVNNTEISPGCTIGSEIVDPQAGFGIIVGYNVFRLEGTESVVPTAADFVGNWQYYMPYNSFDLAVADTSGVAGPDMNGDGLPDGDGTDAPSDGNADGDLVGLQNPDGIPHDGDEVLIFQDSAFNPDGTARAWGTGPDRTGTIGYWYAFQPVLFSGGTTVAAFDGLGFTENNLYVGTHAVDLDGNGALDALDLDMDGSVDFYSPQAEVGVTGYGLTNGGLPLLSAPVFGRANPAFAGGGLALTGRATGTGVQLTVTAPVESSVVAGYNVYRLVGDSRVRINRALILAQGADNASYTVRDTRRLTSAERVAASVGYVVEVVGRGGSSDLSQRFDVELPALRRTRG